MISALPMRHQVQAASPGRDDDLFHHCPQHTLAGLAGDSLRDRSSARASKPARSPSERVDGMISLELRYHGETLIPPALELALPVGYRDRIASYCRRACARLIARMFSGMCCRSAPARLALDPSGSPASGW